MHRDSVPITFTHAGVTYSGHPGERVDIQIDDDTYTLRIPTSLAGLPDAIWEAANRKARERLGLRSAPNRSARRRQARTQARRPQKGGCP